MIWIDDVEEGASSAEGICQIILSNEALYMSQNGFHQFAPVEWIAQAYGYMRGYVQLRDKQPDAGLKTAFMVGVRDYWVTDKRPSTGLLRVKVTTVKEMSPLVLVRGEITSEGGVLLASGQLKLYFEA
jgi:hypothetical protein